MLSRLLTFFSFCLILSSCSKSTDKGCSYTASGVVVPASEMTGLQAYIVANHPAATLHAGGFYYEISNAGTGLVTAEICSNVRVTYAGYLTTGAKFDENTTGITFVLGELIAGWQRGIPLIKKGGSITLYLPPSLGYGTVATGPIPANSILIFNIQLLNVE
jgi:FKBP-type peptidyl-prolyl cis-trans isomerase